MASDTAYTLIALGNVDAENIENIRFKLGIDEEANHADPSLWPEGHPLAPRFPSMHWGWAAGYRFIALEGKSGPNVDQELQFHCIGDEFYQSIPFSVNVNNTTNYTLELNAAYENILKGIDISGGFILHGNLGEIKSLAVNLQREVFTQAISTSVQDDESITEFKVYPNPSADGKFRFDINATNNVRLEVWDAVGKGIYQGDVNTRQIQINNAGFYIALLRDEMGKVLATRKVVVR
jgi:hypothetical protein